MANFEAMFRTNYFKVKNIKKFKKELKDWVGDSSGCADYEIWDGEDKQKGTIAIGGYCGVLQKFDDSDNGISDEKFCDFVQKHLDNDLAIIQEIGNEKLRYLSAYTWYISPRRIKFIDGGFDEKIIKSLGFDPMKVTRAEY